MRRVRRALLAMGFSEAITFAFIESRCGRAVPARTARRSPLANPLSEKFTTLRPSLLPGLIDAREPQPPARASRCAPLRNRHALLAARRNARRRRSRGRALRPPSTGAAAGARSTSSTSRVSVEQLGAAMNVAVDAGPATRSFLVDGRTAEILRRRSERVGVVGQLAPALVERRDLPAADAVYVLELDLDALTAAASHARASPRRCRVIPSVVRDIALLLDDTLSAETVRGTIRAAGPETLVDVREFDRYQAKAFRTAKSASRCTSRFKRPTAR